MEAQGIDWRELPMFRDMPTLYNDLKWIYEGFMRLSAARQLGFSSVQPISISEVLSYCELFDIYDPEDREDFLYFVQFLDKIFLQDMERKKPKSKGTK